MGCSTAMAAAIRGAVFISQGHQCVWCGALESGGIWHDLGLGPGGMIWSEGDGPEGHHVVAPQHGICPTCSAALGIVQDRAASAGQAATTAA